MESPSASAPQPANRAIEKVKPATTKAVSKPDPVEKSIEEDKSVPLNVEKEEVKTVVAETKKAEQTEDSAVGSLDLANLISLKNFSEKVESDLPVEDDKLNVAQTEKNWHDYLSNYASVQLKVMMDQSELVFSEEELKIVVPSELAKSRVLEEKTLLELLREGMGSSKCKMTFDVDLTKVDEEELAKNKLPVTSREKLEYFYQRNENFKEIVERLSLLIKD